MYEFPHVILSLSLSGGFLALLLLLLRPLLRSRLSKRWQYYIWLLVILRLLLPAAPPESPAGDAVVRMQDAAISVIGYDPRQDIGFTDTNPDYAGGGSVEPEQTALQEFTLVTWKSLGMVWLTVGLSMLVRKITAYRSFARYIRTGWQPVDDPALLDRVAAIGAEVGVKRPVELYVNPLAASPMLLGVRKPCVVLPSAELPEEDFRYVLLHELTHCRRRDVLYKWLVQATVCIHWFNPLVYWMARETGRLCELSCDEAVLETLDEAGRRAYGDALLRTITVGGGYKPAMPSATLGESGKLLKERLDTIMKFKKPSRLAAVLGVLLAGALGAAAVAAGAYTGVPAPEMQDFSDESQGSYWEHIPARESRFTEEAFYHAPYMFDIAWNARTQGKSVEVTLPDGGKMTVGLSNPALLTWLDRDPDAREALSAVIIQLWEDTKDTEFPLTGPMLFYYKDFGETKFSDMAAECYESHGLAMFKTAFAMMNGPEQAEWLSKIYKDEDIEFFSRAVDGLAVDGDLVKSFAEKMYANGAFSYFSVLMNRMSGETLEIWLDRAEEDGSAAFQSMLLQRLGEDEELEKLQDELDQKQAEDYKSVGVTRDGKNYYYQGKLVHIFLDHQPGSGVYTLDMNPNGSVNIKILRDADNQITGAAYLTQAEITRFFGEDYTSTNWDSLRADDDDDDWDNWDEPEKGKNDYELDKKLAEAYKSVGVTTEGKNYYYDGKLVNVFLDQRPNKSFYTLDMNPKGTVNIKIVRNADNKITGVADLTESEIGELFGDDEDTKYEVSTEIDSIKGGEFVWLGTFSMEKGDKVYCDAYAETGKTLCIGFAKPGVKNPKTSYMTVSNNRVDDELEVCYGPETWMVDSGDYSLFVHAENGDLTGVSVDVAVTEG